MPRALLGLGILVAVAALLGLLWPWASGEHSGRGDAEGEGGVAGAEQDPGVRLGGTAPVREEASRSPVAAPYRIEGRVVDAEGRLLAGVDVALRRPPPSVGREARTRRRAERLASPTAWPDLPVVQTTSSGDDGTFAFGVSEPLAYRVRAEVEPPLCSSESTAVSLGHTPVHEAILVVESGSEFRGRVVDAAGRGVRAFVAGWVRRSGWHVWTLAEVATSPEDGRFRVEALPAGRWRLDLRLAGGAEWRGLEVELPRADEWTLTIGDATGSLVGRVTDEEDRPVADAVVLATTKAGEGRRRATARGRTDAAGAYRVDGLLSGDVNEVVVSHPSFPLHAVNARGAPWRGARVDAGRETTIDVRLERGTVLEGRVVDADTDVPLAGASVYVVAESGRPREGTTGADGRYVVTGIPPGRHVVVARHRTHYLPALATRNRGMGGFLSRREEGVKAPGVLLLVGREDRRLHCDLKLQLGCSVRGQVLHPRGGACAAAGVHALGYSTGSVLTTWGVLGLPDAGPLAFSDADGRFEVPGLPPRDAWVFYARRPPYLPAAADAVRLALGAEPPEVTLRLGAGATLNGRVLGSDGEGVETRITVVQRGDGASVTTVAAGRRSSRDGSFRLDGVPTGTCTLWVQSADGVRVEQVVTGLEPGEVRDGIEVRFVPVARVSGRVADSQGRPVSRQRLRLVPTQGPVSSTAGTTTDAEGRFAFERAPVGRVQLQALVSIDGSLEASSVGEPFESPASGLRFTYDPLRRRVLKGTVVDAEGLPVPLCRVVTGSTRAAARHDATGGRFERQVVGSPPFEVTVTFPRGVDGQPLNLVPRTVAVSDVTDEGVEIRLEPGIEVAGRVVDEGGQGLGDVLVHATHASVVTDAEGRFRLGGFRADDPGPVVDPPEGYLPPPRIDVRAARADLVVRLVRGAGIAGVVRGPTDVGVALAQVYAGWPGPEGRRGSARTTTDSEGGFRLGGIPPGASCRLHVVPASAAPHLVPATLNDVAAGTSSLVIRLSAGVSIAGTVVDPEGRPVSSGRLEAYRSGGGRPPVYAQLQPGGRFTVPGLEPGTYRLHVTPEGAELSPTHVEVVAPGSEVRVQLPELRMISGKVVGRDRYEGWFVSLEGSEGSGTGQTLAGSGEFTIHNLVDDTYLVRVLKPGAESYGLARDVEVGRRGLVVELRPGLPLAGTLRDAQGTPVEEGRVAVFGAGWSAATTVKDGRFRLQGLPPGRYRVEGRGPVREGEPPAVHPLGEVDAGADDVDLRLP